ncbi:BUD27 (YFL023W) [Zygosaccharomyces parabailii]|nr:BUD27 (YFL023W) [Zygosaccharomyces parabailii]CDH09648.1 uncharacterized protein ZBAI_01432 [Zygosaccharomyces bailii ISA1307]
MNNLGFLHKSVEETLSRLRDKHAFLHKQKRYYLHIRARLLEGTKEDIDDSQKSQDTVINTGLEFSDILISTRHRIFVSIGYEYFVEKSVDEAVEFAEVKLKLISAAIQNFDAKIEEAILTKGSIEEMISRGDNWDEGQEDEDRLPAMEIREELDEEGNVISSSVTPSANEKNRKQLEQTLLGQQQEDSREMNDELSDFEKNLKGKLLKIKAMQEPHPMHVDYKHKEPEPEMHSFPEIDRENMYTFDDLVRKLDEQDELEDLQLQEEGEGEEGEEEENDDNYDVDDYDTMNFSIIPGVAAQNAFEKEIRRLRRSKIAQPRSILKTKHSKDKPKKSVGFAAVADVHEVESLKEENRKNTHRPLVQLGEDGVPLSKQEFDGELFAQLIGAHGPDEVHEKYKSQVEKEQEEEQIRSSKKRISRFRLERKGSGVDSAARNAIERNLDIAVPGPTSTASDIIEGHPEGAASHAPEEESPANSTSSIVEREADAEPLVSDIVEKDPGEAVLDIMERDPDSGRSSSLHKSLKSLERPRKKPAPTPKIEILQDDEEGAEDYGEEISEDSGDEPLRSAFHETLQHSKENSYFPSEKQACAKGTTSTICNPNVDYRSLGENLDDMARAYALGVYDDDLDEDPGALIERPEDFKRYNEEVEQLKEEIKDFQIKNPMEETREEGDNEEEDVPMMTDVVEKDFPVDYGEEDNDDLSLHPEKLSESIALEYRRLKETMVQNRFASYNVKNKELEPVDEWGNPIKESRFRLQRYAPP